MEARASHIPGMHPRQQPPTAITTLALHQGGVVTTSQAEGAGLTRTVLHRLLHDGTWLPVGRGVYSVSGQLPTWDGLAWAGCLLGGEQARLGPQASAHVHGLLADAPERIDVLIPRDRRARAAGPWRFLQEATGVRGTATVGSPPRLTVEDTLLDLCATGSEAEIVGWVPAAVQKRLTTPKRIAAAAEQRQRLRHRELLMSLLEDTAEGAESALEIRFLRDVERAHGLPEGMRQKSMTGLPFFRDVTYDPYALLVELDGRKGHEGEGVFRDMNRDNVHVLARLRTLRYGWFAVVDQPCAVAWQVAQALVDGGWPGLPVRCRRCQRLDVAAATLVRRL